jgi:hypothetical protein
MASVEELEGSGEGSFTSDRDGAAAPRLFLVTVDAPAAGRREDPADYVIQISSLLDEPRNAVTMGSPHPDGWKKNRGGLFASRFTVVEDLSAPQKSIVRVDYAEALVFPFSRGVPWTFSFSPGFGTQKAIRVSTDTDPDTGAPLGQTVTIPIGPRNYAQPEGDSTGAFHANTSLGRIELVRQEGRRVVGADVTFPIGTLNLFKTLKTYPEQLHQFVLAQRNKTNTNHWLGRPPGVIKFVGPQVSSHIGQSGRASADGMLWDVNLLFEDNDEGYSIHVQDIFKGGTSTDEVAVLDAQNVWQTTVYKYYPDYPFETLLAVLEAYA